MAVPVVRAVDSGVSSGKGNPLDKIPKRPGAVYPTWDASRETFEFPSGFSAQREKFKVNY